MDTTAVLNATLTYCVDLRQPSEFKLDSPVTIVGRGTAEVIERPDVVDTVDTREPFQVQVEDTLFICIPDNSLSRRHFCIRRAVGECGERVYLVRNLGSRCGIVVNDCQIGDAEIQLKDGDRICGGPPFVFNLVRGSHDLSDRPGPAVCGVPLPRARITSVNVDRIRPGMVSSDVRSILGEGRVVSSGEHVGRSGGDWVTRRTAVLEWQEGSRVVTVLLEDDKVLEVHRRGLE